MKLREFQADDLEAMHALDAVCFPAKIAYTRAEMRAFLRRSRSFCVVAEGDAGKLSGFLIGETTHLQG